MQLQPGYIICYRCAHDEKFKHDVENMIFDNDIQPEAGQEEEEGQVSFQ